MGEPLPESSSVWEGVSKRAIYWVGKTNLPVWAQRRKEGDERNRGPRACLPGLCRGVSFWEAWKKRAERRQPCVPIRPGRKVKGRDGVSPAEPPL